MLEAGTPKESRSEEPLDGVEVESNESKREVVELLAKLNADCVG